MRKKSMMKNVLAVAMAATVAISVTAHRYLYAVANSNAMNGVDADTTVKNIIAAWQYTYVALVVFVAVMWFFGFKAVRALWASKRYLAKKAERKAKRAAKKAAKANKA